MIFENTKVIVCNMGEREKGSVLNQINNIVFIRLELDGVVLPFELNEVELYCE